MRQRRHGARPRSGLPHPSPNHHRPPRPPDFRLPAPVALTALELPAPPARNLPPRLGDRIPPNPPSRELHVLDPGRGLLPPPRRLGPILPPRHHHPPVPPRDPRHHHRQGTPENVLPVTNPKPPIRRQTRNGAHQDRMALHRRLRLPPGSRGPGGQSAQILLGPRPAHESGGHVRCGTARARLESV